MPKNIINEPPDPEIARRYVRWHKVKTDIELQDQQLHVKEGEIYWASVGQNVGSEIYGKGDNFTRPVLVYKKLGSTAFMGIPLSSRFKHGSWFVSFYHRGKLETALLNQVKTISVKRLHTYMGQVDADDFRRIKDGFRQLYC